MEALQKNELAQESELFIYADAPKNEEATLKVHEVRQYIHSITGFKKVHIIEREKNWGLADNIVDGVTTIVNRFGKIIVLEDDLVTSPFFITYMNKALQLYENVGNVYSVSANMFPIEDSLRKTVLLPLIATWGWGTWKAQWDSASWVNDDYNIMFQSQELQKRFNLADYSYIDILKLPFSKSWGIRWYFHVFKRNGLSVYPTRSLIKNVGLDGSGENCRVNENYMIDLADHIDVIKELNIDLNFYAKILNYFTKNEKKDSSASVIKRIIKKIF